MDGGALVVTVLIAVLDREMHVHVHAATTWTSWVLIVVILRQLHSTTKYRHHNQHMKQQRKRVMSHDYFEPRLGLHQARHYRLATVRGTPLPACDCSPSCTSIACLSVFVFVFG
jgi:hypothetical protein